MLEPRRLGPEDEERGLVERLRAGEEQAFDLLAERYLPGLHRFARRRLAGQPELVRDVVQTTMCKAIEAFDDYRGEAPLFAWLSACCRNEIAAHFRRQGRRPQEVELAAAGAPGDVEDEAVIVADPHAADPEAELLHLEEAELVHAALDQLPAGWARVLEWRYLEGEGVGEITRRLGTTYKATESQLSRARAAFREAFGRLAGSRPALTRGGER